MVQQTSWRAALQTDLGPGRQPELRGQGLNLSSDVGSVVELNRRKIHRPFTENTCQGHFKDPRSAQ